MTESTVTYVAPNRTDAGAVPKNTVVATHDRQSDGAEVQDVFVDPQSIVPITRADNWYNDAFQRQRVSNTDQRFDAEFDYDLNPVLFDNISVNGGTVTLNGNSRDVTIATGGTATNIVGGLAQRWSNIYTKGNSQFVVLTGTLNGANVANGRAETFIRTSISGSIVENVTPQTDWLVTSGIDWTESQIFLMDFQSLRVGRIRFAIDANGSALELTSIRNDDQRSTGYWQTANQPVYWRQYNTADYTYTELGYGDLNNAIGFRYRVPVNASQTMRAICATVKSEGGGSLSELAGIRFSASNGTTKKTISTTLIPVLSIQVKATLNTYPVKAIVLPTDFEITNDNPIYYEWRVNPTLTGASFTSVSTDSITNYDVTASAVTGGRVIRSGYSGAAGAGARNAFSRALTSKAPLGVSWAGVGDILTLCAIRDGTSNASVGASLNFEDIR